MLQAARAWALLALAVAGHTAAGFQLGIVAGRCCRGSVTWRASALGTSSKGDVDLRVTRELAIGADHARAAWLRYVWVGGGGLPVLVLQKKEGVRVVAPLMTEETLLPTEGSSEFEVRYGGHGVLAVVRFLPIDATAGGCRMIWDVYFESRKRHSLWDAVNRIMISAAANNLASHVAAPLLYSRTTSLSVSSPLDALDAWLSFVWHEGGGLPLTTTILEKDERRRLIVPPFLAERIVTVDRDVCEINYTVDNPGLLTYQVHTHRGRVTFSDGSAPGLVTMLWDVEIRPLHGYRGFVQAFTESVITTLCRNIKVHVSEPGLKVKASSSPFTSVRKDSWLGGVCLS
jgi:hypothetical protein